MSELRPERRKPEEAFADAEIDWLMCGGIYVIRTTNGMYRSVDPSTVTVNTDGYAAEADQ